MKKNSGKKGPGPLWIFFSTALRPNKWFLPFLLLFALATILNKPVDAADKLTLVEAIKLGQEHSYTIKSSRYDSVAAYHDFASLRGQRYPTLSVSAKAYHVDRLRKVDVFPTELTLGSHENYQADLRLTVPLYTGGRLSGRTGVLKAIHNASGRNLEAERMAIAARTRRAWLNLKISGALVNAAEASLDRLQIIKNDVANFYRSGMADSVDILDAELAYVKASEYLLQTKKDRTNASTALAVLIGFKADDPVEVADSLALPEKSISDYSAMDLTTDIIVRPELVSLSNRTEAAKYQLKAKKAGYFPNISGFAGYSVGKPNRDFFKAEWDDYFSAGIILDWEFNFGGETINDIHSARGYYHSARMDYKAYEEGLLLKAEVALKDLHHAYDIYQISKEEYSITARKFRLAGEKQRAGQIAVNRLLEMEAELAAAEQLYHVSIINYFLKESDLLYAVGSPKIYGGL